jgi:peptidoglycan hydrolase CwlO-like protein
MKKIIILVIIIAATLTAVWYFMLKYTADAAKEDSTKFRQIQQQEVDTQRKNFDQQIDSIKNTAKDANQGFGN